MIFFFNKIVVKILIKIWNINNGLSVDSNLDIANDLSTSTELIGEYL